MARHAAAAGAAAPGSGGGLAFAYPSAATPVRRRRRGSDVARVPRTPEPDAAPPGRRAPGGADQPSANPAFARGRDFIARCIAGEPDTRDEFVREYSGLIRFAIASVLRHRGVTLLREEIDDLTHNVIVSLFDRDCRKLKMYEGRNQASFATFVRVCSTRLTLDHLRYRQRRPTIAAEQEVGSEVRDLLSAAADPGPGPEEQTSIGEDVARLRRLVDELPAREQLLVRLHFVEGLDVADVARVLGISENATHVLKSRVRAKLRDRMAGEELE